MMLIEKLEAKLRAAKAQEQILEIKLATVRADIAEIEATIERAHAPKLSHIPPRTLHELERAEVPPGYKFCQWCKQVKPASAFHANRQTADRLHQYCKACRGVKKAQEVS